MKKIVYCDIDGTISDDRPRAFLLEAAHLAYAASDPKSTKCFDEYHYALKHDEMWNDIASLLMKYQGERYEIVFLTARTEFWRDETVKWFNRKNPTLWQKVRCLYMRDGSDIRSNEEVKADQIKRHIQSHHLTAENIAVIMDDSEAVLNYLGREYPGALLFLASEGNWERMRLKNGQKIRQQEEPKSTTVDAALKKLADLYLDRNQTYGDSYKKFGKLMLALQGFVPGGSFPTDTEDDWNRLGILLMVASKLSRYCSSYLDDGHPDSLDDTSVYAQMLSEIDREIRAAKKK